MCCTPSARVVSPKFCDVDLVSVGAYTSATDGVLESSPDDIGEDGQLVEGESDREAVLSLAGLRGIDLSGAGVAVIAMGGITNTARYVTELGPFGEAFT